MVTRSVIYTFDGLADPGRELDTTSVTVNLAIDEELRFFVALRQAGKGQDAEDRDNDGN